MASNLESFCSAILRTVRVERESAEQALLSGKVSDMERYTAHVHVRQAMLGLEDRIKELIERFHAD